MSETQSPAAERGLTQDLADLFFAPQPAFASRLVRARFWLPVVAWTLLSFLLMTVWVLKMDMIEFLRNQAAVTGKPFVAPPEAAMAIIKGVIWVMGALGAPVFWLIASAVYLLIFRAFMGTGVTFRQSLTVVAWSFLCVSLVSVPLLLGVMALKGEWNMAPQQVFQTSAAILLDQSTTAKPLYALASSLDLFPLWTLFLLMSGFAVATKRSLGQVALGVLGPWVLMVLLSVGWAALMG
jgi:hypothetical protein